MVYVRIIGLCALLMLPAACSQVTTAPDVDISASAHTPTPEVFTLALSQAGRVLVADGFDLLRTAPNAPVTGDDVVVVAGWPTRRNLSLMAELGVRGVIAITPPWHNDETPLPGFTFADALGLPVVAATTAPGDIYQPERTRGQRRLVPGDGRTLLDGTVAVLNEAAISAKLAPGTTVREAALTLLGTAPNGRSRRMIAYERFAPLKLQDGVWGVWTPSQITTPWPDAVVVAVAPADRVLAAAVLTTPPAGVLALAADDPAGQSEALGILARAGIPMAVATPTRTVADSTRPAQTLARTGVVASANAPARDAGVTIGMDFATAIELLRRPYR